MNVIFGLWIDADNETTRDSSYTDQLNSLVSAFSANRSLLSCVKAISVGNEAMTFGTKALNADSVINLIKQVKAALSKQNINEIQITYADLAYQFKNNPLHKLLLILISYFLIFTSYLIIRTIIALLYLMDCGNSMMNLNLFI